MWQYKQRRKSLTEMLSLNKIYIVNIYLDYSLKLMIAIQLGKMKYKQKSQNLE
jgi:hypothetical protein